MITEISYYYLINSSQSRCLKFVVYEWSFDRTSPWCASFTLPSLPEENFEAIQYIWPNLFLLEKRHVNDYYSCACDHEPISQFKITLVVFYRCIKLFMMTCANFVNNLIVLSKSLYLLLALLLNSFLLNRTSMIISENWSVLQYSSIDEAEPLYKLQQALRALSTTDSLQKFWKWIRAV